MENARKNLKVSAILVLIFTGLTMARMIVDMIFLDTSNITVPEGAPENVLLISKIVIIALGVLILIPQIYVGVKGLQVAENPSPAKGYIVWAVILFIISILSLISPITAIIRQVNIGANVGMLLDVVLDILIFYEFIKYANQVAKGE